MNMFKVKCKIWFALVLSEAVLLKYGESQAVFSDRHSLSPVTFLIPNTGHYSRCHSTSASLRVGVELFNWFFLPRLRADDGWPWLNITMWWHRGQWKILPSPSFPNRSGHRGGKMISTVWVIPYSVPHWRKKCLFKYGKHCGKVAASSELEFASCLVCVASSVFFTVQTHNRLTQASEFPLGVPWDGYQGWFSALHTLP